VWQEIKYGRMFVSVAKDFRPDVVLSSNDPLFAKAVAARWCRSSGTPWVFWLQDVYSAAMGSFARRRLGRAGVPLARMFEEVERWLARSAAGIVAITEDFEPLLRRWGVHDDAVTVIENWAPLDEVTPLESGQGWAAEQGLGDARIVLYSGTLGLKHNPELLLHLAQRCADAHDDVVVVVVSEGMGADWLRDQGRAVEVDNLRVIGFQPWARISEVLASSSMLVVLLNADAGIYSVPSKILTYLCAARPIVGAMPLRNLGARVIERVGVGKVVAAGDAEQFSDAVIGLLDDDDARRACGAAGRAYAECAFDIADITARFDEVLGRAVDPSRVSAR
jgi:glycosyltransferase involved in cell wall biosynthesis